MVSNVHLDKTDDHSQMAEHQFLPALPFDSIVLYSSAIRLLYGRYLMNTLLGMVYF